MSWFVQVGDRRFEFVSFNDDSSADQRVTGEKVSIHAQVLPGKDLAWYYDAVSPFPPTGARNLTHLLESLDGHASIRAVQIHAMPVQDPDLNAAAEQYAFTLRTIAGSPLVLHLVHLGLGPDGHTASLVSGDPVLQVTDQDVALTGVYRGRHRMTLTYSVLNRSRQLLWVVTGLEKAEMAGRLNTGETSIPAGRVQREHALVLADRAAAANVQRVHSR